MRGRLWRMANPALPPEWRANGGLSYDVGRWFVNTNLNYQDEAFWGDVDLGPSTKGFTDAFTMVNVGLGVRVVRAEEGTGEFARA